MPWRATHLQSAHHMALWPVKRWIYIYYIYYIYTLYISMYQSEIGFFFEPRPWCMMFFFFPLGFQQHWRLEICQKTSSAFGTICFLFQYFKAVQNGPKLGFFSKTSRVSFQSTEEQIGVSDTDDSVSEASMATDETGGMTIEAGFQMISVEQFFFHSGDRLEDIR